MILRGNEVDARHGHALAFGPFGNMPLIVGHLLRPFRFSRQIYSLPGLNRLGSVLLDKYSCISW